MRQGQEHHVVPGQRLRSGISDDPVGKGDEVGMVAAERRTRGSRRGEGADPDLRVSEQQSEELTSDVPARAPQPLPWPA